MVTVKSKNCMAGWLILSSTHGGGACSFLYNTAIFHALQCQVNRCTCTCTCLAMHAQVHVHVAMHAINAIHYYL